jgi:hypothetical protein
MQFLSGFGDGIDYTPCVFALDFAGFTVLHLARDRRLSL